MSELEQELARLTRTFIDTPSVTGDEAAMGQVLEETLKSKGFQVQRQTYEPGRDNLLATVAGSSGSPRLLFNTHYDTVPPFIPSHEDDEFIWGRGACDTKGSIAAQILAAEALVDEGYKDIGLLYVVGEEVDHCGMIKANELGLDPEFLIVAEPTESKLATGQKGAYKIRLDVTGKTGHSGYPHTGKSAIDPLIQTLYKLQQVNWASDDRLGPTTMNVGLMAGGFAANVIAGSAFAEIVIRVSASLSEVRTQVQQCLGPEVVLHEVVATDPHKLGEIPGYESCVVAFHTDIPYFKFSGTAFLWGAGSILDAHTDHEKIKKADLVTAREVYMRMGKQLLGIPFA